MPDEKVILDLIDLKPAKINLDNLFLDPNNPRFASEDISPLPESRITEPKIQERLIESMTKEIGIDDLVESIQKYGFIKIDRIVVRRLDGNNYLVLEGNRRVASLKYLINLHNNGKLSLDPNILNTLNEIEVLVYTGDKPDIAWIIQGLRHLTGVKTWPKLQRAKFLTEKFFEEKNLGFREIARLTGMKSNEVGISIRSYYAYKQARNDDEYGDNITPDKFSMFEEAVFARPSLKSWLGWNDNLKKFENIENFKKLLSWITPQEGEEPRITRALELRDILSKLVTDPYKHIFAQFDNNQLTIHQARALIDRIDTTEEIERELINLESVYKEIEKLYYKISTLPIPQISKDENFKNKFSSLLHDLKSAIEVQLKMFSE